MQLKVCSILQRKFASSFNAVSSRIPLFKAQNSFWPQAATNLPVNDHTFQTQKNIMQCGSSSQQLSCVCRTQLGLGRHQWEQLASLYYTFMLPWHTQLTSAIKITMNWRDTGECMLFWKEGKRRRAEACILNCQTIGTKSMDEIEPEDHFRKNESLRFSWKLMIDQPGCV